ncbi:hypothetical protein B9T29_06485 [Acinetobacter sp. ANC 3903]|uniref:hypothetical protein n=1 Tax=Acinetobacter sp. ANC 3903 TaxID=1977883 RepID=UPI000A35A0DF|nr:hypothetical protein [Acinetobacter sp. ANC 3903]OTG62864.1 hypothetical protein B9T29_06485 [Acinetobacter sp. ANC 3903]
MQLNEDQLSNVTLSALINLLKLKGYDLEKIKEEYNNEIFGSLLTGTGPQFKTASKELLGKRVNEANSNPLL